MTSGKKEELQSAFIQFMKTPFPKFKGSPRSDQLDGAWEDLVDEDSFKAGYVSQLAFHEPDEETLSRIRRFLVVDEELTERIRSAPDDPATSIKGQLLDRKLRLDELIRLGRQVLEEIDKQRGVESDRS